MNLNRSKTVRISARLLLQVSTSLQLQVILSCEGLDTLATVKINDRPVISADNMFRIWTADVKHLLNSEEGGTSKNNCIQVAFRSTVPFMAAKQKDKHLFASNAGREEYGGEGWVRKEPARSVL